MHVPKIIPLKAFHARRDCNAANFSEALTAIQSSRLHNLIDLVYDADHLYF